MQVIRCLYFCPVRSTTLLKQIQLKQFYVEYENNVPHVTSFSTNVEKLLTEDEYDARTHGPIVLREHLRPLSSILYRTYSL